MTTPQRHWWPIPVTLGAAFVLLNAGELVFLDGGWPQGVGLVLGVVLVAVGFAVRRGWEWVRR